RMVDLIPCSTRSVSHVPGTTRPAEAEGPRRILPRTRRTSQNSSACKATLEVSDGGRRRTRTSSSFRYAARSGGRPGLPALAASPQAQHAHLAARGEAQGLVEPDRLAVVGEGMDERPLAAG